MGAAEAEKGAKTAQDADLKAWAEKIEAKHKALKSKK